MTQANKPNVDRNNNRKQSSSEQEQIHDSERSIIEAFKSLKHLEDYGIRDLVQHSKEFGKFLKNQGLETNQMRKFLDAVNRIKADLTKDLDQSFSTIETSIVMLEPKLAYAAGRKESSRPLKPFSRVISKAIQITHNIKDFERLVQLIESIIAYHKAEGGK